MICTEARVNAWFENGNSLARNLSPSKPSDKFLGFAAEHAADDYLNPADAKGRVMECRNGHADVVGFRVQRDGVRGRW